MRAAGASLQQQLSSSWATPASKAASLLTSGRAGSSSFTSLKLVIAPFTSKLSWKFSGTLHLASSNTAIRSSRGLQVKPKHYSPHLSLLCRAKHHHQHSILVSKHGRLCGRASASSNDGVQSTSQQDNAATSYRTDAIVWPSESDISVGRLDCIFVLGGGQTNDGGVPLWVQKRLDAAFTVYTQQGGACPIVVMGGGTPHRPPVLNERGYVIHEGTSCAAYLVEKHGMNPDHILKEWSSYDTIANGYFALVSHAIPRGWRRIMMVTSAFHFPRSQLIFEWMFGLEGAGVALHRSSPETFTVDSDASASRRDTGPLQDSERASLENGDLSSSDDSISSNGSSIGSVSGNGKAPNARTPTNQGFSMQYMRVSDKGVDSTVIEARLRKEAASLQSLKQNVIPRIKTLDEVHQWLHVEHKAYNVADQASFGEDPTKEEDLALSSY